MHQLGADVNLVVCQKSKIDDWISHFEENYNQWARVYDLTDLKNNGLQQFLLAAETGPSNIIGIINYELIFRRKELLGLQNFTLLLDESSLVQNPGAKRSKFIMKLKPSNIILLSGTPTGGKYERLLTQMNLLGWKISEKTFWNQYVDWEWDDTDDGFWQKKIIGYKNEERLRRKMRQHGCDFLKTEEVFDLPLQIDQKISIPVTEDYVFFKKNDYIKMENGTELVGDAVFTKLLYERQLCGPYNKDKMNAFKDLIESTEDRLIVFYNFASELVPMSELVRKYDRPIGLVNGAYKEQAVIKKDRSVLFIQYQAGAMGLNLQEANKIIYFTPPLSSELFEQSKKRIHRINQTRTCFYYYLVCRGSIEEKIYNTLSRRKDYTDALFRMETI